MSTAGKVILIVITCVVLLVAVLIGAAAFWWVKSGRRMVESGINKAQEGMEYGRNVDNKKCLDESIARYKREPGMGGSVSGGIFLRSCLDTSRETPGFCADVPLRVEFLKSAAWQAKQAQDHGINDEYGKQLFVQVQVFCESQRILRNRNGTQ